MGSPVRGLFRASWIVLGVPERRAKGLPQVEGRGGGDHRTSDRADDAVAGNAERSGQAGEQQRRGGPQKGPGQ